MSDPAESGTIEVRIDELAQLFNSLDPSPFRKRDLDREAEEHIVGWARELPVDAPLVIVFHLPKAELQKAERRGLAAAMCNYFADRSGAVDRELRELFRNGRHYLAIGVPVLVLCLVGSQLAHRGLGTGPIASALEESLIIVGWVANWKPLETFLYDWGPLKRRRDVYRRLAQARVEIRPTD